MRRLLSAMVVLCGLAFAPGAAHAGFHLWDVQEVFSNQSGTIQYIELVTNVSGQQFISGSTLAVTSNGTTRTFTFPGNSPTGTTNKTLLIATPGFAALAGVTPDFTLPCGSFFDPTGPTITVNFAAGQDVLTITTATLALPTNGNQSLTDSTPNMDPDVTTLGVASGSPRNFAGTTGTVNLSAGLNDGTLSACSNGVFCDGPETCTASACVDAPNPCPLMCNETTDTCFECMVQADCDDANPCTDETCNASLLCIRSNNSDPCNDNLFCTQTDTCTGGTCVGAGATCGIQNCSEGGDFCGDCDDPGDCADGAFCNGDETCAAGACGSAAMGPCDLGTMTCDEGTDTCPLICGDGTIDGAEACDDGNTDAGDGCADCAVEDGFTCDAAEPTVCMEIPPVDAGVPDAEPPSPDAEVEEPPDDSGCDCSTGGGAPTGGTLLLLALVATRLGRSRKTR